MKKFYKSTSKKAVAGVLGGLSESFNISVGLLRFIFFLVTIFTSGAALLVYLAAAFLLPKDKDVQTQG